MIATKKDLLRGPRANGPGRLMYRRLFTAALLASVVIVGCSEEGTGPVDSGPDPNSIEPTGGTWKTMVIASGSAITVDAPNAAGSQDQKLDIDELKRFQSNRTAGAVDSVKLWDTDAVLRWNEIARSLVSKYKTNPPMASRLYALLSVAQYDALVGAWHYKFQYNGKTPSRIDNAITPLVPVTNVPAYPSEHAAIAAASAAILANMFPSESLYVYKQASLHEDSRMLGGLNTRNDITAGDKLGRDVATAILAYAKTDGSDALANCCNMPTGAGKWYSTARPPSPPVMPMWGKVRPWVLTSVEALRPGPPPAWCSKEMMDALAEVRHFSDTRTDEQLRIVQFWADGAGTATPAGHWNMIAGDLIKEGKMNELRAARTLALLNIAMMDAGICCWDAKYTYYLIRPSQADTLITTPVGLPNFPSYTSGHSSFSGAAATVLSYLFPARKEQLEAWAEEAAVSRLYGGIHYRFDSEIGLTGGRTVGGMVVAKGKADGSPQ